jgi:alkylhydroperoxidase/carboxymuconolactone decarboxylase family protein YurZ
MKPLAWTVMSVSVLAAACSHASPGGRLSGSGAPSAASTTVVHRSRSEAVSSMFALDEIRMVSPALEKYTRDRLLGEVWKRPGLAPRDRSIVTLAALIARNQTIEMPYYLNVALDNGVTPREISETITHLSRPPRRAYCLPLSAFDPYLPLSIRTRGAGRLPNSSQQRSVCSRARSKHASAARVSACQSFDEKRAQAAFHLVRHLDRSGALREVTCLPVRSQVRAAWPASCEM